jgi:hypothetical protein
LGQISKQGSTLLRWVLGQAAPLAARGDTDLQRLYLTIMRRRGRPKAKVALARRLLVRLYIMLRDQIDYEEFCRRGRAARVRKDRVPSPAPSEPTVKCWSEGTRSSAGVPEVIDGLP